jgi:hypothetical protein
MVKKSKENSDKLTLSVEQPSESGIPDEKLVYIGSLCFKEGKIEVSVDKEANPECAKLLSDYLVQQDKDIVFVINSKERVKGKQKD